MIKVLHFFKTYLPDSMGGIEQVIFQLCEGGPAHGIDAEVLYVSKHESCRAVPIGNHVSHRSAQNFDVASTPVSFAALRDFRELSERADLVHYHFPWPFMDIGHFLMRSRKPTVLTYHSDIVKQKSLLKLYAPLMHRFLGDVDRIVASSESYYRSSPTLKHFANKVQVIPFGLDEGSYPAVDCQRLQYWKNQVGQKFFLFVGALRYYKGLTYLLRALQSTDMRVVIVGDGPMADDLKREAGELKLQNVHFLGKQSDEDKVALLKLSYGFVFPSHLRSEAFGMSLLEAAMFGKPMITCEIGSGMSDINIDGVTGFSVPPADPLALRAAMQRLWGNPDVAARLGRQARDRYENKFRSDTMLQAYADLYRSLI
ncbi:rhamnosyl/mannosyltransferase [Ectopseudomonas oleovorans]|uniref:Rhamnosyl/mannosyltransferase n=1 Tax=Ectopseudomonas oleovorans TaxID=301 RepID=A0A3D9EJE4_ECTOL|nr:rhamnosyl/mannosyltransferase [Pseudomonas oleovorans]